MSPGANKQDINKIYITADRHMGLSLSESIELEAYDCTKYMTKLIFPIYVDP